MSRVFFDTNLFVYLFEEHPDYLGKTLELLDWMNQRDDELVTSWMTVAEVQIKPRMLGEQAACTRYAQSLERMATLVPFGKEAAEAYLHIRAATGVKGPDAIQLACAAASGVQLFVTNDARLTRLAITGIDFIVSLDRLPF